MLIADRGLGWREDLGALEDFVRSWHGPLSEADGYRPAELDPRLPPPLRRFYELAGRKQMVHSYLNSLVLPEALDLRQERVLVYVESQGVYEWAFERLDPENPCVEGRWAGSEAWSREEERLCAFLLQLCVFEAVSGAPFGASASWCSRDEMDAILASWKPAALRPWRWPSWPTRFYQSGSGALAVVSPNGEGFSLWCGGRTADSVGLVRPFVTKHWEHVALG
jgi:hypothetical protein